MSTTLKSEQPKTISAAARKAERDREAAVAWKEYEAEQRRIEENRMRLRALRLARERQRPAADASSAPRQDGASGAGKRSVRKSQSGA